MRVPGDRRTSRPRPYGVWRAEIPSVCLLDGDQAEYANSDHRIYNLPGTSSPEAHVLNQVSERLDELAAKLTIALLLPIEQQERVKRVVRQRALTNWDRHVIWEQIGEDLDFTSGHTVASAFLAIWAHSYPGEVSRIVDALGDLLPRREL